MSIQIAYQGLSRLNRMKSCISLLIYVLTRLKDQLFEVINIIMGNVKRYLLGIHHAITAFAWRFNHRYDLKQAFQDGLNCIKATRPLTLKSLRHVLCT